MSVPTVGAFLDELRSKLAVVESPRGSNCQEFSHHLGRPCEAWCADFLVASADRTGLVLPSRSAYTPTLADAFHHAGRYGTRPAVGAFGFVWHDSMGRVSHTFAVEAVNRDGSFATLEGNTDAAGGRTGGRVMRHRRTMAVGASSHVVGFGYPIYRNAGAVKPTPRPAGVPAWWTHPTKLGDVAQEVASVCIRLKIKPRVTFDKVLDARVRYVQHAHGLEVDGIVGPVTARAIG